jgi:hypothetical protein
MVRISDDPLQVGVRDPDPEPRRHPGGALLKFGRAGQQYPTAIFLGRNTQRRLERGIFFGKHVDPRPAVDEQHLAGAASGLRAAPVRNVSAAPITLRDKRGQNQIIRTATQLLMQCREPIKRFALDPVRLIPLIFLALALGAIPNATQRRLGRLIAALGLLLEPYPPHHPARELGAERLTLIALAFAARLALGSGAEGK